jgi:hypothetical protein
MSLVVARGAERQTVRHLIAQGGKLCVRLEVMRVQFAPALTAILTGVVVTSIDGLLPVLIAGTVAVENSMRG